MIYESETRMPTQTTRNLLLQPIDRIGSTLSYSDLIDSLDQSIDNVGRIKPLGQTAGSLEFYGRLDGDTFWIRRKDSTFNPFARTCRGKVFDGDSGAYIEYFFGKSIFARCLGTSITLISIACAITLIVAVATAIFSSGSIKEAPGAVFVVLLVAVILYKAGSNASFSADEVILDHLRRIASGAR